MFFHRNRNNVLAVDLAPDAVRLIELRSRKGGPTLELFAQQSIEAGPNDTLPERHLAALSAIMATHRISRRRIVAALPTSVVLTRAVSLDKANAPAGAAPGSVTVEDQILWTLANCLPFDPRDLVFDYWPIVVPAASDSGAPKNGDVLVVATQSSVVGKYLKGFERLGLTCTHLDVEPCAIATLIAGTVDNRGAPVGAVAISSTGGFFAIAERGRVLFWRPFELPAGTRDVASQACLDRIGDEISKCVSHVVGSMHVDNLAEMLIFGNGAGDLIVSEYLKNRFHLPVRSPSPFDAIPADAMPESLREAILPATATMFATATGLAIQQRMAA